LSTLLFAVVGLGFFLLHLLRFEGNTKLLELTLFSWLLIVLLLYDLRTWRVPGEIVVNGLCLAVLFAGLGEPPEWTERLLGAVFGFGILWCVLIISTYVLRRFGSLKENEFAVGSGDPLILCIIGAFMGYPALPAVLFWGGLQGVGAFVLMKLFPRHTGLSPWASSQTAFVPFGAFLCLAALELLIWVPQ
jgi:prepilin signal peptidase PulO-like enzyme (type II secretory pathway)